MAKLATAPPFGAVGPPYWTDRPAFLVGGGASLIGFDFARLKPLGYVCGINESCFDAPCDAGISIDHSYVRRNRERLAAFAAAGELYLAIGETWHRTVESVAGAIYLREAPPPLSLEPGSVARVRTSGYAALNLAVLKRARRIVLLGFDYGPAGQKRLHYHDAYGRGTSPPDVWRRWAQTFDKLASLLADRGVEVVNASPRSAITCFAKTSIDDALIWARRAGVQL